MNNEIFKYIKELELNPPAAQDVLKDLENNKNITLPKDYMEFMLYSNGAEGKIGPKSYLSIWPAEQILELNDEYEVKEFTPSLLYFGSDGGDMAYAFDFSDPTIKIVEYPFVSIHSEDKRICGNSFEEFLSFLFNQAH